MLCIVFSKDRGFQLDQCLQSLYKHCIRDNIDRVIVIRKNSCQRTSRVFEHIRGRHQNVEFIVETQSNGMGCILQQLLFQSLDDYIMFLTDDVLIYAELDFGGMSNLLSSAPHIFSIHTRLSPTISLSQTRRFSEMTVPALLTTTSSQLLSFFPFTGSHDWTYPWDLTGGVYRKLTVVAILDAVVNRFGHKFIDQPNLLEVYGNLAISECGLFPTPSLFMSACLNRTSLSVITINCVQNVYPNPVFEDSHSYTLIELDSFLMSGCELDESYYVTRRDIFDTVQIGDFELAPNSEIFPNSHGGTT